MAPGTCVCDIVAVCHTACRTADSCRRNTERNQTEKTNQTQTWTHVLGINKQWAVLPHMLWPHWHSTKKMRLILTAKSANSQRIFKPGPWASTGGFWRTWGPALQFGVAVIFLKSSFLTVCSLAILRQPAHRNSTALYFTSARKLQTCWCRTSPVVLYTQHRYTHNSAAPNGTQTHWRNKNQLRLRVDLPFAYTDAVCKFSSACTCSRTERLGNTEWSDSGVRSGRTSWPSGDTVEGASAEEWKERKRHIEIMERSNRYITTQRRLI